MRILILKVATVAIISSILLGFIMSQSFSRSIYALTRGAEKFGNGYLKYKIEIESKDEFGTLAQAFNEMSKKISDSEKQKIKQSTLQKEMDIAQNIQESILPPNTVMDKYAFHGYMKTADEVGGDYYDYLTTSFKGDKSWWFMIGDVSGHGLEAGLIMLMAQTALRNCLGINYNINPRQALSLVNKTLFGNIQRLGSNKYMTAIILKADNSGQFTCSGLHLDILIYKYEQKEVLQIPSNGMWLGVLANIKEDTEEIKFKLGIKDVLLLYTDGLTESMNRKKDIYEEERLISVFRKNGDLDLEKIQAAIIEDLDKFTEKQKQFDDITFILIKREN